MKHRGFSVVEVVIISGVIVLLGGLGFVGWKALTKQTQAPQTASTTKSVQVITTKEDLDAAQKALGELNFEDSDAAQAESQASL
jgi:hypothetical protein